MIKNALQFYDFDSPKTELIRHNENMTYKIIDNNKSYLLRIHNPVEGFNLDMLRCGIDKVKLISDEVKILQHLEETLWTQKVKLSVCGNPITFLDDDVPVTVLEWVEGVTIDNINITSEIAWKLGAMIGKMHNSLVHFTANHRYCYDNALLMRMIDESSNALIQGHFTKQQSEIIANALNCIGEYFSNAKERFMIVHTDLGKSNIILQNDTLIPIDFSLSGFCIPEMDLASAFAHINDDALNESILNGYTSANKYILDEVGIEACFCLQILLFVVCQHNKFAKESWFGEKLDEWCSNHFNPLIIKS